MPCPGSRPRRCPSPPGTSRRRPTTRWPSSRTSRSTAPTSSSCSRACPGTSRSSCTTRRSSCGWRTRCCSCRACWPRRSARRYVAAWYRGGEVHSLSPPDAARAVCRRRLRARDAAQPPARLHGAGRGRQQPAAAASQPPGGGAPDTAAPRMACAGRIAVLLGAGAAPASGRSRCGSGRAACRSRRARGTRRCWRAACSTCSPRERGERACVRLATHPYRIDARRAGGLVRPAALGHGARLARASRAALDSRTGRRAGRPPGLDVAAEPDQEGQQPHHDQHDREQVPGSGRSGSRVPRLGSSPCTSWYAAS